MNGASDATVGDDRNRCVGARRRCELANITFESADFVALIETIRGGNP
jgi:hypothetical protein